ncbi:MAG: cation-translocating P-type ATPase [Actinomycetes bacterium]
MDLDPSTLDVEEVARRYGCDVERGLSSAEAARRLETDGPNELRATPPTPRWRAFARQFQDPLIYLLLGAVVVSLAAWQVEGTTGPPFDALVIASILVVNAVLGYVQEARAADAVAALKRRTAPTATVVRDGRQIRIPTQQIVTGDLLVVAEGDAVGADARLVSASTLMTLEASLTGESEAVLKDIAVLPHTASVGDRVNILFNGTAVARGVGRGVVTATGMATEMGHVAALLDRAVEATTPLQREIARVGRMLGIAVVVIAVGVMVTIFLTEEIDTAQEAVTVLLLGVSLAVAAVPEGLPAILSVVLAIGVRRMAAHHAIVKQLSSVETLGCATVICSDKTGTLTTSEMTIQRVVTASGESRVTGIGYRPDGRVQLDGRDVESGPLWEENVRVISGGALASNAVLDEGHDGWTVQGDPTEGAFLVAERKLGSAQRRISRFRRLAQVPFTSERKLMSSLEADSEHEGRITVVTKGAPEVLLPRCTHVQVGASVEPLDDERRVSILAAVDRLSDEAFRTLAVAYKRLEETKPPTDYEAVEHGLVFAGMVGIIDPPRPEAATAVDAARRAGVRVLMITGDHPRTAIRIASDLDLVAPDASAVSGTELAAMDAQELADTAASVSVYARVAPADKLRIVEALQARGNVVAMTGDGVNDAPALQRADIGVAMGIAGTEVSKQAANMILADDNFATIVEAVHQGRVIFDNIKKFLRYLLSSNMGEVLTVFLGVVGAGVIGLTDASDAVVLPLLATQILWVNLLTDAAPALAMGVDPETDDVMGRPPRQPDERLIDGPMWFGVVVIGLTMALATLATVDLFLPGGLFTATESLDTARTAGFTVLVLAQLFNCFNARSETVSAFRRLFVNRWLWAAIGLSFLLQVAVVQLSFLNQAFTTSPLTLQQWTVCIAMASAVLWVSEASKLARRTVTARRSARSRSQPGAARG